MAAAGAVMSGWPPPKTKRRMEPECSVCGEKFMVRSDAVHIGNGERVCRHTCLVDYLADAFSEAYVGVSEKEEWAEAERARDEGWTVDAYVTIQDPDGKEVYSFCTDDDTALGFGGAALVRCVRAARILQRVPS